MSEWEREREREREREIKRRFALMCSVAHDDCGSRMVRRMCIRTIFVCVCSALVILAWFHVNSYIAVLFTCLTVCATDQGILVHTW